MNTIDRFFTPESYVEDISEDDYRKVTPMIITSCESLSRLIYKSLYIIDFHKKNLLYVSGNPFFLCNLSPLEVKEMGLKFHIDHIPEEEHEMLLEINQAGFDFLYRTPVEDRLKLVFSCDFHVRDGNITSLINHKLTPLMLSGSGKMWLAACLVSLPFYREPGHAEVRMEGITDCRWTYSPESREWEQKAETPLSDREKKILSLSAQGLIMKEIADRMPIKVNTIKACKKRLFQKLNAGNISEAISVATGRNMI